VSDLRGPTVRYCYLLAESHHRRGSGAATQWSVNFPFAPQHVRQFSGARPARPYPGEPTAARRDANHPLPPPICPAL